MRKIQPAVRAYLQITLLIPPERREEAISKVYLPNRLRILDRIEGAVSMDWLARQEDVQVLLGFDTLERAQGYQESPSGRELTDALGAYAAKAPQPVLYTVD